MASVSSAEAGRGHRFFMRFCLPEKTGRLVLTVPLGYNPALDAMIADDQLQSARAFFIRRTGRLQWEPTTAEVALDCRYGSPFPYANAVMVAEFGRAAA